MEDQQNYPAVNITWHTENNVVYGKFAESGITFWTITKTVFVNIKLTPAFPFIVFKKVPIYRLRFALRNNEGYTIGTNRGTYDEAYQDAIRLSRYILRGGSSAAPRPTIIA